MLTCVGGIARRSNAWGIRRVWTWGNADFGRSGDETTANGRDHLVPMAVKQPPLPQNLIRQVVCGGAHTLLLSASGSLYSCGLGTEGQLGHGTLENHGDFRPLDLPSIAHASAGFWHCAAASSKGQVFCWGMNKHNQGQGSPIPLVISALEGAKVIQVACGAYHTLALTDSKEVYSWGMGANGRLGHGDITNEPFPRRTEILRGCNIVSIAAGYDHSAAVSEDGRLWTWGHGGFHQLGTGDKNDRLEPALVDIECNVKQASCGGFHTAAVAHNGSVYTWGVSMYGALGLGDDVPTVVKEPRVIEKPPRMHSVKQVACGWKHSLAVTKLGDVFAWGHGACGQLGLGNEHDLYEPRQISALVGKSLVSVSAGFNHSAAF